MDGLRTRMSILLFLIVAGDAASARLELQIVASDIVIWRAAVQPGETFDLTYEHSQEHTTWTQHYAVSRDGRFYQFSSTFSAYGAGMPLSGRFLRSETGFTVYEFIKVEELPMMNWRRSRISLIYRGSEFAIGQQLNDFQGFVIRVR